jgi:hypothetical protein
MSEARSRRLFRVCDKYGPISRRPLRRVAAAFCLTAVVAAATSLLVRNHLRSAQPHLLARIDCPLPSLVVQSSQGKVDLRTFAVGSRCIIVFYSSSCKVCRRALPALQPLPEALRLILVNEAAGPDDSLLKGFPDAVHFHDQWKALKKSFAAASLPVILFVDERGILRDGIFGARTRSLMQQKLRSFAVGSSDHMSTDL